MHDVDSYRARFLILPMLYAACAGAISSPKVAAPPPAPSSSPVPPKPDVDGAQREFKLGVRAFTDGQKQSAIDHFRKAIKLNPYSRPTYRWLGHTFRSMGNEVNAFESYEIFIDDNPSRNEEYEAIADLVVQLQKKPLVEGLFRGVSMVQRHDNDRAIELLTQVQQLALGTFGLADRWLAVAYLQRDLEGDLTKSYQACRRYLEWLPLLKDLADGEKFIKGVKSLIEKYDKTNPDTPWSSYLRGKERLAQNRVDEAIKLFESALQRDPAMMPAYHALGDAYAKKGDVFSAFDCYSIFLETLPPPEPNEIEIVTKKRKNLRDQAGILEALRVADAEADLNRASFERLNRLAGAVPANFGWFYWRRGNLLEQIAVEDNSLDVLKLAFADFSNYLRRRHVPGDTEFIEKKLAHELAAAAQCKSGLARDFVGTNGLPGTSHLTQVSCAQPGR